MSAKKTKKKSGKRVALWVIFAVEIAVLALALLVWWGMAYAEKTDAPDETIPQPEVTLAVTDPITQYTVPDPVIEELISTDIKLDERLQITDTGSYAGAYVEDGSNEIVSGVLMIVVSNISDEDIQYAEITLPTDNGDASFNLSTLPAGESCVLMEQNRMLYTGREDIAKAFSKNVATFTEPLSLQQELLKFQILDGAINITNISGEDIQGDIVVYYKNAAADIYYGGITYRVRIEGGMKVDEIKQIMASHFSDSGSKIMFVTVG